MDVDVVCLGESMVTFLPSRPGRLADVPSFVRGIGGAESNVACGLAASGHSSKWLGRVGADGFGDHLVAAIAAYGVDTTGVQRDPLRPTGIYFRTAGERPTGVAPAQPGSPAGPASATPDPVEEPLVEGAPVEEPLAEGPPVEEPVSEVVYYRAGSAASAMAPGSMPYRYLWSGRILHLSGITAALSPDCLALMRELTARAPGRPLVSFDVNYRANLWHDAAGPHPRVLLDLARGADLVFVGEDEAEAAWGLTGAAAIRAALPEPEVLVIKQGSLGATVYARTDAAGGGESVTFVPALTVDVVASVGAGDAFAAGFLSATLRGLPDRARIRHGHLMAAAALTVPGDLATPPARAHADRLAALDARAWGTLRLGPGWILDGVGEDQVEVRTA
ncbi:sugar kinase [Streptomyces sp. H27-C3]|uniref:sugar kinase n=1 Tax=Streptomyces sp. H27-C3 TaxID=3046305 RepID=UPI0024B93682|nr:sugar kinase [Streptomyces sp. H27-C3]MDJ0465145.1 sugar kinase [Streptomyces sp. H27-C3]